MYENDCEEAELYETEAFNASVMCCACGGGVAPTPAPTQFVSAVGDPHLSNVAGERFDIYQPGTFVLLQVPRRPEGAAPTLLRVEADAKRMGDACSVYFQAINITGKWTNQSEPLIFVANAHGDPVGVSHHQWMHFGTVDLKVTHRKKGIDFLNLYAKNVGHTGYAVGGLLGSDDHTAVAVRPRECSHKARKAVLVSSIAATTF